MILASKSEIRATLLRNSGVDITLMKAAIDEESIKASLQAEYAKPRDVADVLAEMKALRIADKGNMGLILGADQVLEFEGELISKPRSKAEAMEQIQRFGGKTHKLISAAVIVEDGKPVWRNISEVRLTMRQMSPAYVESYVERNWDSIRHSVGGYKIEEEGARFFTQIFGDNFTVMGLPLLAILQYLITRGILEG